MTTLFRLFSWRHNRRHLLRLFLAVSSIMLGVALFVSMQVSQMSTVRALENTTSKLTGKAEYTVWLQGGLGVDAGALGVAESVPGVIATPVLRATGTFADLDEGAVMILGIDLEREMKFREFEDRSGSRFDFVRLMLDPRAVVLTESFTRRNKLKLGDTLRLTTPTGMRDTRIAGIVADRGPASVLGGNLAVMKIGTLQRLFGHEDRYDRIDIAPSGDAPILDAVRAALGPAYRVEPIRARSGILDIVLARLKALVAVSVIALLVGLFIIYLSVAIGVVERSREIGTLRAIGASRGQILTLLMVEAGILGVVGSGLGILFGYALARWLTEISIESINILVQAVDISEVVLPPSVILQALVAGTVTSLAAAFFPALRATRISPLEALRPALRGFSVVSDHRTAFKVGAALTIVCAIGIMPFDRALPAWSGLLLTAGAFIGMALILPQITFWISLAVRRPLRFLFRIEGYLAADNALQYPQRTALTVTALGGALAILVATASTVTSFHVSVKRWMDEILPFDLTIWPATLGQAVYSAEVLPHDLEDRVKGIEGVSLTYPLRAVFQEFGDTEVLLVGVDFVGWIEVKRRTSAPYTGPLRDPAAMSAFRAGETAIVSSNFAVLNDLEVGDTFELSTRKGRRSFRIVEAMEDYSYPLGSIYIDLAVYTDAWADPGISYLDLALAEGHTLDDVRTRVGKALADDYRVFVYSADDIKSFGLAALDQSFQITYVQVLTSMVIGFFGIVNTLLISVLRRTREIGLLRSIGMGRGQVARTVVIEALFIAVVGGVLGVAWGLWAAAFPVSHHIVRLSGFTLPFMVPWVTVLAALGAALVIGFFASLIPARRAAAQNVLEAVGYE